MSDLDRVYEVINSPEFIELYYRLRFSGISRQNLQEDEHRFLDYIELFEYWSKIIENLDAHQNNLSDEEFDKFLQIYEIYRDHIKHEDTLGNQRLSFFVASQSFLFFPYFNTLKDYRANGYNSYDFWLLFLICLLGLSTSFFTRHSVRAFVVAADRIAENWKTNYRTIDDNLPKLFTKDINTKKYDYDKKKIEKLAYYFLKSEGQTELNNNLSFIDKNSKVVPNIRYETDSPFLLLAMKNFSNKIPMWFMVIWVGLFLLVCFLPRFPSTKLEQSNIDAQLLNSLTQTKQTLETTKTELENRTDTLKDKEEKIRDLAKTKRDLENNLRDSKEQNLDLLGIIIDNSCQAQIKGKSDFKQKILDEVKNKKPDEVNQHIQDQCKNEDGN